MVPDTGELTAAILAMPRLIALDLSIPAHMLGSHPGYRVLICGADPVAGVTPTHDLSAADEADILIVPGYDDPELPLPAAFLDTVRAAADRGARVVAICTGAFALADAGVLDGREATTHWQFLDRLRELHPGVRVRENRLFVQDGRILTSAGGGAAIDACLHLISADFGVAAADEAGKGVVAAPARGGEQPQYVEARTPARADLSPTRDWVLANLGEPITVARLAERSNLSRRTFVRHFEQETGLPPMRWVTLQRLFGARRLLERSDWPVERIAAATGFGTAANFRVIFRREVGLTPSGYRRSRVALRG
ncbi:GlxA family transcriptional regulator [Crossiella cryophila]|uniref:Transcriptional regulator GlxA family with amidase domain n=1 Tax=Crossiella cryophila TaxID=43355 RepID=A0A7W7CBB2_9PSEU|nr:helix-turn-helix domain-containing protein [Crossiella cryophila]MBB4677995.1 transcriptional regulator GlxA family with amidase domain [Crossiella cryophila]